MSKPRIRMGLVRVNDTALLVMFRGSKRAVELTEKLLKRLWKKEKQA